MSTRGQAGFEGLYSLVPLAGRGGDDEKSMLSDELCSTNGDVLSSSSISVDGGERQNSGIGCCSWTFDSEGLTGLGKEGMLNAEAVDCREFDLLSGETEKLESECSEGKPCSWKAFHADNVGELGVIEARNVWMRKFGANDPVLGGRDGRWCETKRSLVDPSDSSPSPASSSMPCMMLGLVGRLGGGPRICGVSVEMRTQFCLRWPFLALGLPFSAEGFGSGWLSHWNGLPLLLLPESFVALEACLVGGSIELPEMSLSTEVFFRSAGEPVAETDARDARRGVVIFRTPVTLLSELADDTRLMLTRSAVAICGMDKRL